METIDRTFEMHLIMSKPSRLNTLLIIVFALLLPSTALAAKPSADQQRADIRKMASGTLERLYGVYPNSRKAIESASGYAVFSNFGMKILFAGIGKGQGIAISNETKKETFMKMFEVQAGLGMGVKKFRVIFIFENKDAFDRFITAG